MEGQAKDLYVAIKQEFLLPKKESKETNAVRADEPDEPTASAADSLTTPNLGGESAAAPGEDDAALAGKKRKPLETTGPKKLTLKQRHQGSHPAKEDRLCSFVG